MDCECFVSNGALEFIKFLVIIILFSSFGFAANDTGEAVDFSIENDSRTLGGPGSDNAYTNGFRFSYIWSNKTIPNWANVIFLKSKYLQEELKNSKTNFGLSIAQQIFTPNDIQDANLIVNDRPYAAWLYLGFTASFKTEGLRHSIEVDVGVIGPEAAGEAVQNGFHSTVGIKKAQGWKYQLKTEPTLQINYQARRKYFELKNSMADKYFDIIPYYGFALGNVSDTIHIGGLLRIGYKLPDDFGPSRISSSDGVDFVLPTQKNSLISSIYGFTGARLIGVGRNIFLDGNSFQKSQSVTRQLLVAETEIGTGVLLQDWTVIWRFVSRSPEFYEKNQYNSFASVSLFYAF